MDDQLFAFINGFAGRHPWLDFVGVLVAVYFPVVMVLMFAVFCISRQTTRKAIKRLLTVFGSGVVAYAVVKPLMLLILQRPRPYAVLDTLNQLIVQLQFEKYQSFPSGHSLFFFACSTAVFLLDRKIGKYFLIAAALIAISRVYVGVHWPSDVAVGALLGVMSGWLVFTLVNKYFKKHT